MKKQGLIPPDTEFIKITSDPAFYQELWNSQIKFDDPHSVYISRQSIGKIILGKGTRIRPNVYFLSPVVIGKNCVIGPQTTLANVVMGDGNIIEFTHIIDSRNGYFNMIGPHAQIETSSMGNENTFGPVQIERSRIGNYNKGKHHCYIGDTQAGNFINFSAGLITANYGGEGEKHITVIEDGAFLGANVNLVAHVVIGRESFIGDGATIRKNVTPHAVIVGLDKVVPYQESYRTATGWVRIFVPKNE